MLKKIIFLAIVALFTAALFISCKSIGKAAIKHWTRKQKKEFVAKCKDGAVQRFGERANEFCSCVVGIVEEKYPKAEDGLALSFLEVLKLSKDCVTN